jgi:hypothetical protein
VNLRRVAAMASAGFLILLGHLQSWQPSAMAQATQSERAFVYGINAAVPDTFVGTFAPPSADAIFLLADGTSVISARYTEIYFWPITNEYRADWSALNEPVPGVLEVVNDGRVVAELTSTNYTIHFKQEGTTTTGELFLGQDAVDAEADFRARQEAFHKASSDYQRAEQAWLDAMAEVNSRQQAGETVEIPPEPVRPEPIGIFSNGLNSGFPVDLDPGQYDIRLRGSDGAVVPESERTMIIFAPRRTGVGYTIVPETRWTTPLESSSPSDIIFGAPDSALYLEPLLAREYPARDWSLLQYPQRLSAQSGGWEWVNGEKLGDHQLEIVTGDVVADRRSLTPYNVRQVPGSQLGYEVIEMDSSAPATAGSPESRRPDFEAYPIDLQAAGEQFQIRLTSEQGEVVPGSIRQVRVPGNPPITRLFVLPVIPLIAGALVISRRHRGVRPSRPLEG